MRIMASVGLIVGLLLFMHFSNESAGSALVKQLASKDKMQQLSARVSLWSLDKSEVPNIAEMLQDKNPKIRLAAVTALWEMKDRSTTAAIASALNDKDKSVRLKAAEALSFPVDPAAADALMAATQDKEPEVVICAIRTLGKIKDKRSIPMLVALLKNKNSDIKYEALWALKHMADPEIYDLMVKLTQEDDDSVVAGAATALGTIGDRRALGILSELLNHKEAYVRHSAAFALSALGEEGNKLLISALQSRDVEQRIDLFACDVRLPPDQLTSLLDSKDQDMRCRAVYWLVSLDDPKLFDIFAPLAKDANESIARAAVAYMIKVKGDDAEPYLPAGWERFVTDIYSLAKRCPKLTVQVAAGLAKDSDWIKREQAVDILSQARSPEALDALLSILRQDESPNVRPLATHRLAWFSDPRVIPFLINTLKDPEPNVANSAAITLGKLKAVEATDALLAILSDKAENEMRRATVAQALAEIGVKEAIPATRELLKSKSASVREEAARALGCYKAREAVPQLIALLKDKDEDVRQIVARALGDIGDARAFKPLLAATKDRDDRVRGEAIYALGCVNDKGAFDKLVAILKDVVAHPKPGTLDVEYAIGALAELGDKRALPYIIPALATGTDLVNWGASAAYALAKIGDNGAVQPLIGALSKGWVIDEDDCVCGCTQPVRSAAAYALAALDDPKGNAYLVSTLRSKDIKVVNGAYRFYINYGIADSEPALVEALDSVWMANDYIDCGNSVLRAAGVKWLSENRHRTAYVEHHPYETPPVWNCKSYKPK